ncbi:class I adenylate-forming enzyme family protein [Streptomyces pseudovenezuelae]|uniref:Acyl-CoA synthetase (AMP-forming)/AMP-acid ligase II n=1 Tax=Streptomyces pseudovenezuelae TaxID=67350 RepID=A0ABT6LGC1_9ACTN|nr:class I adenylate-forming enzyme family protein [Streptomyces pseudovenezuelae]MDH6214424.1 acyl-CoA synthetase (AMP-forming)/AMP-acid ligase II [Streptomyces pseudovenezuelae]
MGGEQEFTWTATVAAAYDNSRPAVRFGDLTWTGRELLDRAAGAADWLDTLGLDPDAPVPALAATSADALALVIGGAGSGHPLAPLGVRMTPYEIAAVVETSGAQLLVAQPEFAELGEQVAQLSGRRAVVVPELRPSVRTLTAEPDDLAAVLHTSGTTGLPKPVRMTQRRLAARARVNGRLCALDPDSFYGGSAPFHHIAGLGNIAVALAAGALITGLPRFTVEGWALLRELGTTHTSMVPAMLETLLAAGQAHHETLRTLQYGGAPVRPGTLRRTYEAMPGVRMLNMFGQTEGSPISVLTPDDHREAVAGRTELLRSVGRPAPGVELRVGEAGADGIGEIHARADHFFRIDAEGWLHSGDLGRVAPDGYLYLYGRGTDMIIRGGENVHPLEVETVLAAHPGVADVAVTGAPDERLGQTVVAFVVPADPDAPPEPASLRSHVRARLSGFKVPVRWWFVADLPRNANGKVVRRRLREPGQGEAHD